MKQEMHIIKCEGPQTHLDQMVWKKSKFQAPSKGFNNKHQTAK